MSGNLDHDELIRLAREMAVRLRLLADRHPDKADYLRKMADQLDAWARQFETDGDPPEFDPC